MFTKMTAEERLEAFEIIVQSIHLVRWGFDYVNDEMFVDWYSKLGNKNKSKIYEEFNIAKRQKIMDYFNDHQDYRIDLWRSVFQLLNKVNQIEFLEGQCVYYTKAKEILDREKFEWSTFTCPLEDAGETSKLHNIKRLWNELGMQVYGCRDEKGALCPCLRECCDSAASYKCFRDYLQNRNLSPYGNVPMTMLYSS